MVSFSRWYYTVCGFNEPYWRGRKFLCSRAVERYGRGTIRNCGRFSDEALYDMVCELCYVLLSIVREGAEISGESASGISRAVFPDFAKMCKVHADEVKKVYAHVRRLVRKDKTVAFAAKRRSRTARPRSARLQRRRARAKGGGADPDGDPDRHRPNGGCVIDYLVKPGYLSQSRRRFFH